MSTQTAFSDVMEVVEEKEKEEKKGATMSAKRTTVEVPFEVIEYSNGTPRKVEINGGGISLNNFQNARAGLYALEELHLGVNYIPEAGLHLKADIPGDRVEGVGYVGSVYQGFDVKTPDRGWMPLDSFHGALVWGSWENGKHEKNTQIKHALIHDMSQGTGFTVKIGPRLRNILPVVLEAIELGGKEGRALRAKHIRGKIESDRAWRAGRTFNTEQPGEELIVKVGDDEDEVINLFDIEEETLIEIADNNGRELPPKFWNPESENNLRWWAGFASRGGMITQTVESLGVSA